MTAGKAQRLVGVTVVVVAYLSHVHADGFLQGSAELELGDARFVKHCEEAHTFGVAALTEIEARGALPAGVVRLGSLGTTVRRGGWAQAQARRWSAGGCCQEDRAGSSAACCCCTGAGHEGMP